MFMVLSECTLKKLSFAIQIPFRAVVLVRSAYAMESKLFFCVISTLVLCFLEVGYGAPLQISQHREKRDVFGNFSSDKLVRRNCLNKPKKSLSRSFWRKHIFDSKFLLPSFKFHASIINSKICSLFSIEQSLNHLA